MVSQLPTVERAPNARPFVLRPDWNGQLERREILDVNLGHTPESFVRAAHAQLAGHAAPDALVRRWAGEPRTNPRLRLIDLVRSNRNYDYWVGGSWRSPEHFMRKVRVSQNTAKSLRRINVIG